MATVTGGIKSEINRFDGEISFGLWQRIMNNILIQQGIKVALLGKEKKPAMMDGDDWADLDERVVSSILQYISDKEEEGISAMHRSATWIGSKHCISLASLDLRFEEECYDHGYCALVGRLGSGVHLASWNAREKVFPLCNLKRVEQGSNRESLNKVLRWRSY
ncbi:hypothetical protein MRB53_032348 [Persea americana]|uniref:Uncharacterized protein n=1 Tax=Persea americana TaxID=3435 RepID=A0ACC2KS56_PERAE|nr:hypothetical protein MRB53_032348 [Persea americana]